MDVARDDFLADAAFAGDQNLGVGPRNPLDFLLQRHGLGTLTVQLHVGLGARACRSGSTGPAVDDCIHHWLINRSISCRCFGVIARNCAAMRYPSDGCGAGPTRITSISAANGEPPTDTRSRAFDRTPTAPCDWSSTPVALRSRMR